MIRDKEYLKSAKDRVCCICYKNECCFHHVRSLGGGIGLKPSDDCCIPVCDFHHKEIHNDEKRFLETHAFIFNGDVKEYANNLYKEWLRNKS